MEQPRLRRPSVRADHGHRDHQAGECAWSGYYEPPTVYQYDVYVSEANLFDVKTDQLVWSGTVETESPRDITKELARYVDTVIEALKKRHLLAAR